MHGVARMRLLAVLALARGAQACTTNDDCGHGTCKGYKAASGNDPATDGHCVCTAGSGWSKDQAGSCTVDPCTGYSGCGSHGTCTRNKKCDCDIGYKGNTCGQSTGCDSDPDCGHGTCVADGSGHTCNCGGSGYDGPKCGRATGCDGQDCSGHGTCKADGGSHTCDCSSGWSRNECAHPTGCDSSPCQHGGTCTATGGSHSCACAGTGYTGDQECGTGVTCTGLPPTTGVGHPTEQDGANIVAEHYPSTMKYPDCPKKCGPAGLICHEQHLVGDPTWKCNKAGTYEDTRSQAASETLTCQACPGISYDKLQTCDAQYLDCKSCGTIRIIGNCHSECTKCDDGYGTTGTSCDADKCPAIPLDHGTVTYSRVESPTEPAVPSAESPPDYSGSPGHETTHADFKCDPGYSISYDKLHTWTARQQKCMPVASSNRWVDVTGIRAAQPTCEPWVMSVQNSSKCQSQPDGSTCACASKAINVTRYSTGIPNTDCSPAGEEGGRLIGIDPLPGQSGANGNDGVTKASTFSTAVARTDPKAAWNTHIQEGRAECVIPSPLRATSLGFGATFDCWFAGRYTITTMFTTGSTNIAASPSSITLVPNKADPVNTVAFLENREPKWCEDAVSGAPRCRTRNTQLNQVVVIVRDEYGNPRPGTKSSEDYVRWWTQVEDTHRAVNEKTRAEWQEDKHAYLVEFTFTEPHDSVFKLQMTVNDKPWEIDTSTSVWHDQNRPISNGQDFSLLWSDTIFKFTLFMSLNSQTCEKHTCDDSYVNPTLLTTKDQLPACTYSFAGDPGCLFYAGMDQSIDINQFQVLADWNYGSSNNTGSQPSVSVDIKRFCGGLTDGAKRHTGPPVGLLYWETNDVCGPDDSWNYTHSFDGDTINVNHKASPQIATGSWKQDYTYNGTVLLNVLHPGVFNVVATLTLAGDVIDTSSVLIVVGPGPVSPEKTHMRFQYIDVHTTSGAVTDSDDWGVGGASFANWKDGGANEDSKYTPKLKLWIDAVDHSGNPRIGRDEVFIQLTRPLPEDLGGSSASLQLPSRAEAGREDFTNPSHSYTWMTDALCKHAQQKCGTALFHGTLLNGTYTLPYPAVGTATPAGAFSFKEYGVYQLSAWICPGADFDACAAQESTRLLSNFRAGGNAPTEKTYDFTVCPSNTAVPDNTNTGLFDKDTRDPDPPPGFVAKGLGGASRGALMGVHLDLCKCLEGFSGLKSAGVICNACPPGTFQSRGQAGSCQKCMPGRWCGCSSSDTLINVDQDECKAHNVDWGPACMTCDVCADGKYQNQRGKDNCHTCQTEAGDSSGFFCPRAAAFPMAKPGYWVSSRLALDGALQLEKCEPLDVEKTGNPSKSVVCPAGADGVHGADCAANPEYDHGFAWCPGSPLVGWTLDDVHDYSTSATDRQSINPDELVKWVDAWDKDFQTTTWHPDGAATFPSLNENDQKECWHGSHDNGFEDGDPCLQVLGSRCRMGHKTVEGRDKPCSVCCDKGEYGLRYPNCDGEKWHNYKDTNPTHLGKDEIEISYCVSCKAQSKIDASDWIIASFFAIAVAGLLVKFGVSLADKLKDLKPPVMTLITFLQVVNLFTKSEKQNQQDGTGAGGLHWPPAWKPFKDVFSGFGALFNFTVPDWLGESIPSLSALTKKVNPECVLALPYWQKWMLWMLSPWLLLVALGAYYCLRVLVARSATFIQDILEVHTEKCERCVEKCNAWVQPAVVFVQGQEDCVRDAKRIELPHGLRTSVMKLMHLFYQQVQSYPLDQMVFQLAGQPVMDDDSATLESCGVADGATLHVSLRIRGGGRIATEPEPEPQPEFEPVSRPASLLDLAERVEGGDAMSRPASPDQMQQTGIPGGEPELRWRNMITKEEITGTRPTPSTAIFRLQGEGRRRWCESCKIDHVQIKPEDVLEDATDVQLPGCLQCLADKRIPCTRQKVDEVLPTLVLVCGSAFTFGAVGWIGGTLVGLSTTFGLPFTDKLDVSLLSGEVAVALKGATCLLSAPLIWALFYVTAVGSNNQLRPWLRRICCKACIKCCDETSLSNQLDQEQATHESFLAPRQLLNRAVLEPLANSPDGQLSKIMSVWHGYLWFGLINLITVAVEPLACVKNPYGQYFMSASGAESIECNWCTKVRDFKGAFPAIGDGVFAASNGFGLFGLGGLFTIIPLQGYPLFASMSAFCTVFYFTGIPLYFTHKVHTNREHAKERKFPYAFLTDKMKETYPHWEVVVMVRKGTLALFSVFSSGHPIASTLANLFVTITAACLQFWKAPYAHPDMNRVEDSSQICTILVLMVGLGGQAAGGGLRDLITDEYVDQDTLNVFNDFSVTGLILHFLHTIRILLNRLSRSVWLIRETGGCGCGWVGATVAGLVLGGIGGFAAAFGLHSWWTGKPCDLKHAMDCVYEEQKHPLNAWLLALAVFCGAVILGAVFYALASRRLCWCCSRRGKSCCCIQTLLCSRECTFPGFVPCCCAPEGCCQSQRFSSSRTFFIRNCTRYCFDTDDCKCCEASTHGNDSGEYELNSWDKHNKFQERTFDRNSMGNKVRKVLNKNKLELVDVWVNYGIENAWEEMDASELLDEATRRAVRMEDTTDHELWKELTKVLDDVKEKQVERRNDFDRLDGGIDDRDHARENALNVRFKNEAINVLRTLKQADVTRVMSTLTQEYDETKKVAKTVTEVLQYFPEDVHWQRVVYYWMTRDYPRDHKMFVSKEDKAILINELLAGMKGTASRMRKELLLNQTVATLETKAVKKFTVVTDGLRNEYEIAAGLAERNDSEDSDSEDDQLRESFITRHSQLRDDEEAPLINGPAREQRDVRCTKCKKVAKRLNTGPILWSGLVVLAATVCLLVLVANSIGCCGESITGMTEHFAEAVKLCEDLDNQKCATKWADTYHLSLKNCTNLQRSANCSVDCKEGYVWSNADLNVGRSKVFTCGNGDKWNLFPSWSPISPSSGRWLAKFRTPKWHFVNWTASTNQHGLTSQDPDHTGLEDDPATCHKESWMPWAPNIVCTKKQAHPHCWADPCYSPHTSDKNKAYTACGANTTCVHLCADGAKPLYQVGGSKSDSDVSEAPLCGNESMPYAVKYPSQKQCACVDESYAPYYYGQPREWTSLDRNESNTDWSKMGCRPKAT